MKSIGLEAETCPECLRFGRSYARVTHSKKRTKAGNFKLPRSWPTRQEGKYVIQYCPGELHVRKASYSAALHDLYDSRRSLTLTWKQKRKLYPDRFLSSMF